MVESSTFDISVSLSNISLGFSEKSKLNYVIGFCGKSCIQGTKSHLRDEAHEIIRQQEVKSLASAVMLDHSHNALLRVWLAWVLVGTGKCSVRPGGVPRGALPLPPCTLLPARGSLSCLHQSWLTPVNTPCCQALGARKKAFSRCCRPRCPHVILCPQGSDADWLLPAISHIASIIGEKKKDKIKAYVKELCQDYPDIRYIKPELLGSIPQNTSLSCAWAKLFSFSLLVATC